MPTESRNLTSYTLTEFLELLRKTRPDVHYVIQGVCAAWMLKMHGLPCTYKGAVPLALEGYVREILRNRLKVDANEYDLKGVTQDRLGFTWRWPHPRKQGHWVRVVVTDVELCLVAGLPGEAYYVWSNACFADQHAQELLHDLERFPEDFTPAQRAEEEAAAREKVRNAYAAYDKLLLDHGVQPATQYRVVVDKHPLADDAADAAYTERLAHDELRWAEHHPLA